MKRKLILPLFGLLLLCSCAEKGEYSDWRGPKRDGIYPETGLLKQWPYEGPALLWSYEELGFGHTAVAVSDDKVYLTGIKDSANSLGTLFVLDTQGNLLWEKEYGKDFTNNFIGKRSTPVVVDDLIYIESGAGAIYCLQTENGEEATYNSPILIEIGEQRLLIAMTAGSVMGIDAATGEMYWRIEQIQQNKIHTNTPLYADGRLLVSSADPTSTSGLVQMELLDEGTKAQVVWRDRKFRNLLGGLGSREHWARPVIHQGILYIRHGEALMAYDIKDPKINID
jgi:hypothetical protein